MLKTFLPLAALAALVVPALPAIAQNEATPHHATASHGALAGRSPHKAYRHLATKPTCGKQMHSMPAGKLPHYGLHAHGKAGCTAADTASTDGQAVARAGS